MPPWFTNADQLVNDFNARHFEVQTTSNESPEYGLPNARLRFLAVAFYHGPETAIDYRDRSIERSLNTFTRYLELCKRTPECLTKYRHPDGHLRVESYFAELQTAKKRAGKAGA